MPCHTAGPALAVGNGEGLNRLEESVGDPGQDVGGEGGFLVFSSISISGEDRSFVGVVSSFLSVGMSPLYH